MEHQLLEHQLLRLLEHKLKRNLLFKLFNFHLKVAEDKKSSFRITKNFLKDTFHIIIWGKNREQFAVALKSYRKY